jgi:hypothetical protein
MKIKGSTTPRAFVMPVEFFCHCDRTEAKPPCLDKSIHGHHCRSPGWNPFLAYFYLIGYLLKALFKDY